MAFLLRYALADNREQGRCRAGVVLVMLYVSIGLDWNEKKIENVNNSQLGYLAFVYDD